MINLLLLFLLVVYAFFYGIIKLLELTLCVRFEFRT